MRLVRVVPVEVVDRLADVLRHRVEGEAGIDAVLQEQCHHVHERIVDENLATDARGLCEIQDVLEQRAIGVEVAVDVGEVVAALGVLLVEAAC